MGWPRRVKWCQSDASRKDESECAEKYRQNNTKLVKAGKENKPQLKPKTSKEVVETTKKVESVLDMIKWLFPSSFFVFFSLHKFKEIERTF